MSTSAASLKAQFDLHTRLYSNALEGLTDAEANRSNSEHVNHMKWVAGHLLNTRVDLLSKLTGKEPDTTYGEQFGRGKPLSATDTYPPLEEITSKWKATAASIGEGIANIPEEALAAKTEIQTPIADDTFRGLLSFLISHEAYHIGQLGLLRKLAGKEAMSYK